MNRLYSNHIPVVRDTTRSMIVHSPATGKAMPEYITLTIPAFTVPQFTWPTPSIIVTEFRYTTTEAFSILKPIIATTSPSYCLAIRWVVGDTVVRYKLWSGVGETLHYPLYNSQLIPVGQFVIEVWTVATSTTVSSAADYTLTTTLVGAGLIDDTALICSCERTAGANITLTETCAIFQRMPDRANLPFVFDTCLSAIPTGYKFVLTWGANPKDLDFHVRASISGITYHIWYGSKGDWSILPFIALDRDDTNGYGPESVIIGTLSNPGTYHLYVKNYEAEQGHTGDLWTSGAQLKVYDEKNTLVNTIDVPEAGAGLYWDILTLVDGVFNVINVIQVTEPTL